MRAALVAFLLRLIAALPLGAARGLGRALGGVLYRLPNRERRNARVNLRLCFPELGEEARDVMLRGALRENAVSLLEMPGAWAHEPEVLLPRIEVGSAADRIRKLLAAGKGLIIAAPHLGNWEVGIHFLSSIAPITVLYRPPRQRELEEVMVRGRSRSGARLVPTTPTGVRALREALRRGEMIAVLPDQQPKRPGSAAVFAPFFGVPALTMTLLGRLAAKSGAPVLFAFTARRADGRYQFHWLESEVGIASTDPVTAATALNRGVERCVRVCPEQYQWTYRRFAARPGGAPSPYG